MSSHGKPISRIAIIGAGQVGTAAAYAIILHSLASELLLVDIKTNLRNGQVNDLSDVSYSCNSKTSVRAATHQEARDSDIVVITAGSNYSTGKKSHRRLVGRNLNHMRSNSHVGETSTQHNYQKVSIIRSIINEMKPFRSDTILLVVANPVDLLTSLAYDLSDLPASQVLGSGTFLDSVRIRSLLAEKSGVRAQYVYSGYGMADQRLGRGQLDRSLRSGRTWGLAGCGMVRCDNCGHPNQRIAPAQHFEPRRAFQ